MATLTMDNAKTGQGGAGAPILSPSARGPLRVITGKFSFDNSYPTGGEDISGIFDKFSECLAVIMQDPTGSAGTGKKVVIDMTNKKAMLYDNAAAPAQVANLSDQSGAVNLRFIAWGYGGFGRKS